MKLRDKEIGYLDEPVSDYQKAVTAADTRGALLGVVADYVLVAADAHKIVANMTDDDFAQFRKGLAKERRGRFAGEEWATKWSAVTMPEVMFRVAMLAERFKVPWGCAYRRLRDEKLIRLSKKGVARGIAVAVWGEQREG